MAPLTKSTEMYACHGIPLELDVYQASDYPRDSPVFLFFHSGGLVAGARSAVPPWLVQACYKRKWPLVSAAYRLLPQVQGDGLLDDAKAAYNYARTLGGAPDRGVVVGGASAGFFMATITAHHVAPKPLALLSITGIPTFQHPFFNSSYLIPPEPISEEQVEPYLVGPATVGKTPYPPSVFYLERLLPSGAKNPDFEEPKHVLGIDPSQDPNRGLLYDYYLYLNAFEPLVSSADPGYEWASQASQASRLAEWPVTVLIQGDADEDVKMDVCADTARWLGEEKGRLYIAKGQPHLFEMAKFLEDETPGMEAVHQALHALDTAVSAALTSHK